MTLPTVRWSQASIKDVCDLIVDCVNKTAPTVPGPTAYKMIRTTNVRDGWVNLSEVKYVTEEVYEKWTRREVPRKGDVILTREAPLGEIGMLRSNDNVFLGQRLVMYRADPEKLDNRFLLYAFQADYLQGQIKSLGSGATAEHMRVPDCEKLVLDLPPLPTQRKIASILSAYDDLIENNTRRIEILEEMAHATYREWFVNFRFPGHENVGMVDSQLGPIPEGWQTKKLSEVASVQRGRSYKSANIVEEGGLPFLNLKNVDRDGGFRRNGTRRYQGAYKETQTANSGDVIMAVTDMTQERRIVARAARVPDIEQGTAVFSMDLVKITPHSGAASEYLYGMLRYSGFPDEMKQFANGANVLHLNPSHIEEYVFAVPPKGLRTRYTHISSSIYRQTDLLHLKNDNLRLTRDLLLPKLISGEVPVEEIEVNGW